MMGGMMPGMGAWSIAGIVFLALAIAGAVWAVRRIGQAGRPPALDGARSPDKPLEILRHRYAAGEIDEDEYLRRLSGLSQR